MIIIILLFFLFEFSSVKYPVILVEHKSITYLPNLQELLLK